MEKPLFLTACEQCFGKFSLENNLPRFIPVCGHTICSECILGQLSKLDSLPFCCPFDKREYKLKEPNITMFPVNFELCNELQTPKKHPQSQSKSNCLEHQKPCELICIEDKIMICTDCALFGVHRGHTVQKATNVNSSILKKQRSFTESKLLIEEMIRETEQYRVEKLEQLKEYVERKFNKLIVNMLLHREESLKFLKNYFSEFSQNSDESQRDEVSSQNLNVFKVLIKSIYDGEIEKIEAKKLFTRIIDSISVTFDDSKLESMNEFCKIDLIETSNLKYQEAIKESSAQSLIYDQVIPKFKNPKQRAVELVEEVSLNLNETFRKPPSFRSPIKTETPRINMMEHFIYKYEAEDHKFDKLKRTISNKTVYECQNLKEVGLDLRLNKEDVILLKSYNEDQNVSEIMRRLLKDNIDTINNYLAAYDSDLKIQEGIFKLTGSTTGNEPIKDEIFFQIKNTLSSMSTIESLSLSFMNCSKIRGNVFEDFLKFLGEFNMLQELELTFWNLNQVIGLNLTAFNETLFKLEDLRVLKLAFGEWKTLTDEGIEKLGVIQSLIKLEHFEINIGRTSVTNKGLKLISEWVGELFNLNYLKINFSSCLKINDAGLNDFNQNLNRIKNLSHLILNFDNCSDITDTSLINLCSILQKNAKKLETLSLFFYSCSKISDKTGSSLCLLLPKLTAIKELNLDFRWCNFTQEDSITKLQAAASGILHKKILM